MYVISPAPPFSWLFFSWKSRHRKEFEIGNVKSEREIERGSKGEREREITRKKSENENIQGYAKKKSGAFDLAKN